MDEKMAALLEQLGQLFNEYPEASTQLMRACTLDVTTETDLLIRAEIIEQLDQVISGSPLLIHINNALLDHIEQYEYMALPKASNEVLRHLMKEHKIKQRDLAGIATQSIISEILNGKRNMTVNQIKGFAKFFAVPINLFMRQ